jgi:6-phosphogluconolactonase (cycloisomerase 2 family)
VVVTIGVSPATITLGGNATLTWSSTNATGCTASGAWSGTQATSGTQSVSPAQAGTDTYTLACTGAGGNNTESATLTVNAPASQAFVYTINSPLNTNGAGNISAFSESATDGTLTLLSGSPYNTGLATPYAVAVDQPMNLLFAIGGSGSGQPTGEIVAYAINPTTGALSSMTTTTPPDIPTSLAIGPSGKVLYVTSHASSTVMAYSIATNGALTEVSGSPFAVPATNCGAFCENTADAVVYDAPAGTLYVNMNYSWYVATFTVNSGSGVLTWVNNATEVNCGPSSVSLDTTGSYVYVTDACGAAVNGYQVTTGDTAEPLTPIAGSPFDAGGTPTGAVATGKYFYVLNNTDNTISAYTLNSTSGALTQLGSSPVAITNGTTSPNQIVVDPSGDYLYVSSADYNGSVGGLTQFSIDAATGDLTQVSSTPITPGSNANSPGGLAVYKKP